MQNISFSHVFIGETSIRIRFIVVLFVIFLVYFVECTVFAYLLQPAVQAVEQDRGVFADCPGLELRETYVCFDIYFRKLFLGKDGYLLVADGIIDVSFGDHDGKLFTGV